MFALEDSVNTVHMKSDESKEEGSPDLGSRELAGVLESVALSDALMSLSIHFLTYKTRILLPAAPNTGFPGDPQMSRSTTHAVKWWEVCSFACLPRTGVVTFTQAVSSTTSI